MVIEKSNKFKKEMEASQYFMNKNAKSMFDVVDMCEYYQIEENAVRQTNRQDEGSFVNLLNQEMEELKNNMKDKEKMIEEIANCDKCVHKNICNKKFTGAPIIEFQGCEYYQPKLPKDSIVLSKEEYQKDFNSQFNKGYKHGSKETAEKILQIIKEEYGYIGDLERIIAKQFNIEIKEVEL